MPEAILLETPGLDGYNISREKTLVGKLDRISPPLWRLINMDKWCELKDILAERPEIWLAYVFGSALRNDDPRADIDVAILLDRSYTSRTFRPLIYTSGLASVLEDRIKPRVEWDIKLLNFSPIYFQFIVIRERRTIFVRAPIYKVQYEKQVLTRYLDFKPTLDRYNRTLLERIRKW